MRIVRCSVFGCGFLIGTIGQLTHVLGEGVFARGWTLRLNDDLIYDQSLGVWRVGRRYHRYGKTDRRPPRPQRDWIRAVERADELRREGRAGKRMSEEEQRRRAREAVKEWRESWQRYQNRPPVRLPTTVLCANGHQTILETDTLGLDVWHDADGKLCYRPTAVWKDERPWLRRS
ncbi:MAG TPA: hypothetical protein VNO34_01905 [Actinomycetota bacterium]|nr:hypothetical protein [Actinomycetota bacterium]